MLRSPCFCWDWRRGLFLPTSAPNAIAAASRPGLEQALHRPVKFGALSFRLLPRPGFSIENAEVDEDPDFGSEPFARVDHIDCDLRWHSLWRSRMDFAHLHLDHPSFNIVLNSRGEWNVEKLLLQSGVTAPTGAGGTRKLR